VKSLLFSYPTTLAPALWTIYSLFIKELYDIVAPPPRHTCP